MPNIESAIKRVKTSNKSNAQNSQKKAALRTAIRKFEAAVEQNADNKNELLDVALKALDMAASKGLIHANKAARDKSRLTKKANA